MRGINKNSKILYIILISTFLSINFLGANAPVDSIKGNNEGDDSLGVLKVSGANVQSLWNSTLLQRADLVSISEDGQYIAVTNGSASLTYYHRSSNQSLWSWTAAAGNMHDLDMSASGDYMAISNADRAFLIDSSGTEIWNFTTGATLNYYVDISADGQKIVVLNGTGGGVHLFDNSPSADKKPIFFYDVGSAFNPQTLVISDNGDKIVFVGGASDDIYVFNTTDYQGTYMWKYTVGTDVYKSAISSDGMYFAVFDDNSILSFFNTTDYQGTPMWQAQCRFDTAERDLDITSDGSHAVIVYNTGPGGSELGYVCLFNRTYSSNKVPMWNISVDDPGQMHRATSVDFSTDGRYMVVGIGFWAGSGTHGITQLYDKEGRIWEGFNYTATGFKVWDVAISGYGDYFIANFPEEGGSGKTIHLFKHEVTYPSGPGGGDDDDDDDDDKIAIPGYNLYILIALFGLSSVILVLSRKRFKK